MIKKLYLFRSESTDPYRNLAVEQLLLESTEPETLTLYLWQNQRTVVIGRNQNPWQECRTSVLEGDGGHLARRLSGGGAVYHDLGNLNFTFLTAQADYDLSRQLRVVEGAVSGLGIETSFSGRNDVLAAGRKFSGNAFYSHNGRSYHHGTLLVDTDMAFMSRYLRPSAAKLRSKGVTSVRSRTVNLRELLPGLTVEALADSMEKSLAEIYRLTAASFPSVSEKRITALRETYASWDWNYGRRLPFDLACEGRFSWGEVRLELRVDCGVITAARVWSDAMEWELSEKAEQALTGCRFADEALREHLKTNNIPHGKDLWELLRKEVL